MPDDVTLDSAREAIAHARCRADETPFGTPVRVSIERLAEACEQVVTIVERLSATFDENQEATNMHDVPYRADPTRADYTGTSGILVRAMRDGAWGSVDMMELDRPSFITFLRSRGPVSRFALECALVMADHPHHVSGEDD